MPETSLKLAQRVWETLSEIDVTPHVEYMRSTGNRPAMRYLPWHKAWAIFREQFPCAWHKHMPDIRHDDGTMEVEVVVMVQEGDEQFATNCRLGVMDNQYRAIQNPNARDINDNRQRALVKALAFAGLGLNLWSDSDVPVGLQNKPITAEQAAEIEQRLKETKSNTAKFLKWAGVEKVEDIPADKYVMAVKMLKEKANA